MALSQARTARDSASKKLLELPWRDVTTPDGEGFSVSDSASSVLFDFFEESMLTTIFSYQALESFCNESINRNSPSDIELKRYGKRRTIPANKLERELSTTEKLTKVLPGVFDVKSPKGGKLWEPYRKLQKARNASMHMKTYDQYALSEETLYIQFLSGEFRAFPEAAANLRAHFYADEYPRWLRLWYESQD